MKRQRGPDLLQAELAQKLYRTQEEPVAAASGTKARVVPVKRIAARAEPGQVQQAAEAQGPLAACLLPERELMEQAPELMPTQKKKRQTLIQKPTKERKRT